jgi:ABC-type antimicrobial peptide transport system permease subunit
MVDMLTFRDLYGKMTDSQQAELAAIKSSVGSKDVSAEDAEAALFGGGGSIEQMATPALDGPSLIEDLSTVSFGRADDRVEQSYTRDDVENGLALNAAIILKDPTQGAAGKAAVQAALDRAGLPLQVIDWKAASGMLGQFVTVVQLILMIAVGVMFLVAMVIINNALVMATMERTGEIGTMRAIGAQRGFVISIFVLETLFVGICAGALGSGVSVLLIGWLHDVGIPAGADFLTIVFGGERLYPTMNGASVLVGMGLVTAVSAVATLYPAILAAGVPPVVALSGKE